MKRIGGIGVKSRKQLGQVLLATKGTISADDVTKALGVKRQRANALLAQWANQGWIARLRRGLYMPLEIESQSPQPAIEDPWIVAHRLFAPCYIGGWSAASHWDLTDQIFESVYVVTAKHCNSRLQAVGDVQFVLKELPLKKLFGTVVVWRDGVQVEVSNPSRTIIDLFNDPRMGGGILAVSDIYAEYLRSEHADHEQLVQLAERLNNRAIFKRMGFLTESLSPDAVDLIEACRRHVSGGYARLDPAVKGQIAVSRWRLYVPEPLNKEVPQ